MRYDTAIWKLSGSSQRAARRGWPAGQYIRYISGQLMLFDNFEVLGEYSPSVRERKAGDWRIFQ